MAMNIQKLKEAEAAFLGRFPHGFSDPGLEKIRRRHNVKGLADFAQANLTVATFSRPQRIADTLLKIIGRSSMVSRFEKPPFRAFVNSMSSKEKQALADAFQKRLSGRKKQEGFEEIVDLFARYKLARWSLVSAVPFYFAPSHEAFVKPSTARKIVAFLDIEDLDYHPRPDWKFYVGYRRLMLDIKKQVDPSLTPNNAAISGFMMAAM